MVSRGDRRKAEREQEETSDIMGRGGTLKSVVSSTSSSGAVCGPGPTGLGLHKWEAVPAAAEQGVLDALPG